jgi:hypothetical protein
MRGLEHSERWEPNSSWPPDSLNTTAKDLAAILDGGVQTITRYVANTLSVMALVANAGSLLAVSQTVGGRLSANLRLVVSLTLSDMLVAFCVLATNIELDPFGTGSGPCFAVVRRGLQNSSHMISLLNLLGLAVDHYFAICRPLQYPTRWGAPRLVGTVIAVFWTVAGLLGASDMFFPTGDCWQLFKVGL